MKKILKTGALLSGISILLATEAQASSSVTLYGVFDIAVGYTKVTAPGFSTSRLGLGDGVQRGSRFGLKVDEDLGDGLGTEVILESGFSSPSGRSQQGGRLFGRQASVGLTHKELGRIDAGRIASISSQYFLAIDPFRNGFGTSNLGATMSAVNTVRYDNLVQYQTPSFRGFQAGLGYSFDTGFNSTSFATADNQRALTAAARYASGPLRVVATYDRINPPNNRPGGKNPAKTTMYALGATYDIGGVFEPMLAFAQTRDGWFQSRTWNGSDGYAGFQSFPNLKDGDHKGFRANSYAVGARVILGPASSVLMSWQLAKPNNDRLTGDDKTMQVYSLGYLYDLSKRTNLYAYASYTKNAIFIDQLKSRELQVGISHRF